MVLSGVALVLVLWLLPVALQLAPAPIGPAAQQFSNGARVTVLLTLASGSVGLVLGIVAGLLKLSPVAVLRAAASFYVSVIRGTPLLIQILFVYFGLPALFPALKLSDFTSAVIALALNVGAYNAEVIRGAVLAVPPGQTEAARSLGLSGLSTLTSIVLPQALRTSIPPLVNNFVALLKDSSLAYVIGVVELSLVGSRVQSESFLPIPVFITVATVYYVLTNVLTLFSNALERRLVIGRR